ncbi:MAG: caspase family protein [Gammaproteobacteria bacterium]|nr:caspase family protein [Gammaproteobacteria bacterium]
MIKFSNNIILALSLLFSSPVVLALVPPQLTTYDELQAEAEEKDKEDINPNYWLFAISIEDYEETDDIAFSSRSAQAFVKTAQYRLGISKRRTVEIIDEKATSGRIQDKIMSGLERVQKGDTIFFYYSGHGIPDVKTKEPYILPRDMTPATITKNKFFKLDNIYSALSNSNAGKVIAFVDSCFSGSTDNKSLFKGVAAARLKPKKVAVDESKMVVITAGTDSQFSNQYADKRHRLFSYYLIKGLHQKKFDMKSLYKYVRNNVEEVSYELGDNYIQTPTIQGDMDIKF